MVMSNCWKCDVKAALMQECGNKQSKAQFGSITR